MHSMGADFVIFDGRMSNILFSQAQIQHICHRKEGIGADKLVILEISEGFQETSFMRIYNSDGTQTEVSREEVRCVAELLMAEEDTKTIVVETVSGLINCHRREDGLIELDISNDDNAAPVSYVFEGKLLDIV